MIEVLVELSGEAPELGVAEASAAAEALGGRLIPLPVVSEASPLRRIELPSADAVAGYASRLALARRVLVPLEPGMDASAALARAGASGGTGAVRRLGRPRSGSTDSGVLAAGRAFTSGGGRVDLEAPERRFWLIQDLDGTDRAAEEVAPVDRRSSALRRMPNLPFQRPVSLPPTLARAAANLARIRPGAAVLDPFLGTGALLAEAGLLGGRLYGVDRDPAMVRGALRNLAHFGLHAEEIVEGDAGAVEFSDPEARFDALLSDPPYGRSSGTGGEAARSAVERVVPRWSDRVRRGGRVVLVLPGGYDPLGPPWRERLRVPVRVHRSLTREFRVYER